MKKNLKFCELCEIEYASLEDSLCTDCAEELIRANQEDALAPIYNEELAQRLIEGITSSYEEDNAKSEDENAQYDEWKESQLTDKYNN